MKPLSTKHKHERQLLKVYSAVCCFAMLCDLRAAKRAAHPTLSKLVAVTVAHRMGPPFRCQPPHARHMHTFVSVQTPLLQSDGGLWKLKHGAKHLLLRRLTRRT